MEVGSLRDFSEVDAVVHSFWWNLALVRQHNLVSFWNPQEWLVFLDKLVQELPGVVEVLSVVQVFLALNYRCEALLEPTGLFKNLVELKEATELELEAADDVLLALL